MNLQNENTNGNEGRCGDSGNGVCVRVSQGVAAPVVDVWDAWLNPTALGCWMFGPNVRDEQVLHLKVEPHVGGRFSFLVQRGSNQIDHVGIYRLMDKPKLLEFTWGVVGDSEDESTVTIRFHSNEAAVSPSEDNYITIELEHRLPAAWADYASRTAEAWAKMLGHLNDYLASSGISRKNETEP